MTTTQHTVCAHCDTELQAFELPDATGYEGEFHLACFNDECPYFVRGWKHMKSNYAVNASYRYRVDPINGTASPLPVWSRDAIKDRIIEASVGESDEIQKKDNGGCS